MHLPHCMSRTALLSLLLLALANLAFVHCSKGNSTAAKLKRCSACQIFVRELHDQMSKSSDTKETILKQVALALPCRRCTPALVTPRYSGCDGLQVACAICRFYRAGQRHFRKGDCQTRRRFHLRCFRRCRRVDGSARMLAALLFVRCF